MVPTIAKDYVSRTINTQNQDRVTLLAAFRKSIYNNHIDLLLVNVPIHLLSNEQLCRCYQMQWNKQSSCKLTINSDLTVTSLSRNYFGMNYQLLSYRLNIDWSILNYNYSHSENCFQQIPHINTLLLPSDDDVALGKLGYHDQGRNETSAGVSLSCDAFDGICKGFIRGASVSQMKTSRPLALFNLFVASTAMKTAHMLQRFYETNEQDGVWPSNNLYTINQKQGDRVTANLTRIDTRF
ncbi:unnamed protein product [Adineta steineri]|uniref:Uncharacterized protein n=1 Tax=Adineta steineri TaxID=433720 RepID=A0A814ING1_9BILA|nr:unnamed protein product [Adineta steineri]CAF3986041.1 unnamed protein product [Adineta steineri]